MSSVFRVLYALAAQLAKKPIWALIVCTVVAFAAAQDQAPATRQPAKTSPELERVLPTFEGQNVSRVEIAGRPDVNTAELKPLLPLKEGEPFSRAKADQSVAVLKSLGRFTDVQLQVLPDIRGVRVLLVLQPGFYFGVFRFPGALKRFSYTQLLQVSQYPPEGPYTEYDVTHDSRLLQRYFQQNGYFLSEINPQLERDSKHLLVNVTFDTDLGKKADFGEIDIQGAPPEMATKLRGNLRSIMARLKGAAIRPGKGYSLKTVQNAQRRLESTLASQGYLAADAKLLGAKYDPERNRADIAFQVDTGPKVHVDVKGAHLWSWTKRRLLPVYQQAGVDEEIIQEGRTNLTSYFQKKGYFNAKVSVDVKTVPNGKRIIYSIEKGPRHKVASVEVAGNKTIPDHELVPQVKVKKGGFLSHGQFNDKLVRDSVDNLKAVYKAAGFSDVQVTPKVSRDGGRNLLVSFVVDEGERDIVAELRVVGNESVLVSELAPEGLRLAKGQPYSQKSVDEDRTNILHHYRNNGYMTATLRETVTAVEGRPHEIIVTYDIYEGPSVVTSSVIVVGGEDTQRSYIDRQIHVAPGQPLTEQGMLISESRLYEPNIFDWAQVDPRRHITTQDREDVVVKLHELKPNGITYGFGFEVINRGGSVPSGTVAVPGVPPVGLPNSFKTSEKTFWGPRGHIEYTRRNVRGRAEKITVAALAGRLDQRGQITYQDPRFRGTNWTSNFTINGEHDSTNPIFTSRLGEVSFLLHRPIGNDKTKNVYLRYAYRQTGLTRLLIPDLVPPEDQHVRLSIFSASFTRDTRDSLLDAKKGIYESFEVGLIPQALGASVSFARLLAQTAYYKNLGADIIWANSVRLGFAKAFAGSHVPVSEQFFSGGGSSIRGFPLNGAGPQRTISACENPADLSTCSPISVPTGGNQLFILNSEFRIPVPIKKGLGVVGFYDGGNVFRNIGFHGQYTNTLGAGLRYNTPIGPVRFDVGHNLNAPPGIKSTQYFVTLGQAF